MWAINGQVGTPQRPIRLRLQCCRFTALSDTQTDNPAHSAHPGHERLGPLHEALGGQITYDKLHAFRVFQARAKACKGSGG